MHKIGSKWVSLSFLCPTDGDLQGDGDLHGEELGAQSSPLQLGGLDNNEEPSVAEKGKKVGRKRSRVLVSEEERKERKQQADAKYRKNQKEKVRKLQDENERLQDEKTMWKNKYLELEATKNHSEGLSLDEFLEGMEFVDTQITQDVPACCLTFVEKLKRDDRSNVSYSDLKPLLQGETREMEGYRIPLLLQPTFEDIHASYGDITINSVLGSFSAENVLLQFLAIIKEMGDTSPEQLTGDLILKWKSCILEARRVEFRVEFAMEHLDKIVKCYLSRKVGKRMEEINNLEREKLEIGIFQSQQLLGSQEFQGTVDSVHTGSSSNYKST